MRASVNVVADLLDPPGESAPVPPTLPLPPKRENEGCIDPATGVFRPNYPTDPPGEPTDAPPALCSTPVCAYKDAGVDDVIFYLALGAGVGLALSWLLSPSAELVAPPLMRRLSIDSVSSASA